MARDRTRRLISESRIDATRDQLFEFFCDPDTFQRIAPRSEKLQILSHWNALRVGARTSYIAFGGILPARWELEITKIQQGRLVAETMISGPFASWRHETHFIREGRASTLLRDEVTYQLPWGWPGHVVNEPRIRKRLRKWFSDQHDEVFRLVSGRTYDIPGLFTRPLGHMLAAHAISPLGTSYAAFAAFSRSPLFAAQR